MNVIRYRDAVNRINAHSQESWIWEIGSKQLLFAFDDDCGYAVSVLELLDPGVSAETLQEWDYHVKPEAVWDEMTLLLLEHGILCESLTGPGLQYALPLMDTSCEP